MAVKWIALLRGMGFCPRISQNTVTRSLEVASSYTSGIPPRRNCCIAMKIRAPNLAPALRGARPSRPLNGSIATALSSSTRRSASSLSQRPDSRFVQFPGAVKSAFTTTLQFEQPSSHDAMPTYRAVDQSGNVVDPSFKPDLSDEEVIKLYKDMLLVSIMDIIMFDSQRQGRISFYMVSAGEEAVCVGSASALTKEDVIFCQYREQGVFAQRGFTPKDFMNQLFANKMDPGKGRNMPVHYGSKKLNIVCAISPICSVIFHISISILRSARPKLTQYFA